MCTVCEPLEMSLSIFQRKMNRCHSIVQKVLCRSTTGLELGLDVQTFRFSIPFVLEHLYH